MWYKKTALALAAIGAINWAFAEMNFDLIQKLIVSWTAPVVGSILYWVVALCGVYALVRLFK